MAWRVSREPAVNWEIEWGVPLESLATSDSRVSSPSAANADALACRGDVRLRSLCDMFLDILHLFCPSTVIHAKRFEATIAGNFIEAGFCEQ